MPHTTNFNLANAIWGNDPMTGGYSTDLTTYPASIYPNSGAYRSPAGTTSPISVCCVETAAHIALTAYGGPPLIFPPGTNFHDVTSTYPFLIVGQEIAEAIYRSGSSSVGSTPWWGYGENIFGSIFFPQLFTQFMINFTFPPCYDPDDGHLTLNYTATLKSQSGSMPGTGVVNRLVNSKIWIWNSNYLSAAGSQFVTAGDVIWTRDDTDDHTLSFGANTYSDDKLTALQAYTALYDNASNPGDWSVAGGFVRPQPGDKASLVFTLNTGTGYDAATDPIGSADPTWIEISDVSMVFPGDCGGKNQGHIF